MAHTHAAAEVPRTAFANYMVYRDGRPFLIVNATLENVRHLVERFSMYEAEYSWMFEAQA
jgi:hypothetical protein